MKCREISPFLVYHLLYHLILSLEKFILSCVQNIYNMINVDIIKSIVELLSLSVRETNIWNSLIHKECKIIRNIAIQMEWMIFHDIYYLIHRNMIIRL